MKNFPTRYIHEPWNAPEGIQKAAKCIIGREYSLPMVDHAIASRTNIERLRQVYHQLYKYRDTSMNLYNSSFFVQSFFLLRLHLIFNSICLFFVFLFCFIEIIKKESELASGNVSFNMQI